MFSTGHFCQLTSLLPPGSFSLIPFISSALLGRACCSSSPSYPAFVLQEAALQRPQSHSAYTDSQDRNSLELSELWSSQVNAAYLSYVHEGVTHHSS